MNSLTRVLDSLNTLKTCLGVSGSCIFPRLLQPSQENLEFSDKGHEFIITAAI